LSYQALWFCYFLFAIACELAVALPLLRIAEPSRVRRFGAVVFANLASHPIVWFVLPTLLAPRGVYIVVAESWAIVSEVLVYVLVFPALPFARALAVSALANAASFTAGLVLNRFW
jgi:hypothetical protein